MPTLSERFWSHVDQAGDCWLWTAAIDDNGYGRFQIGTSQKNKTVLSHRFAYELLVGPVSLGLDHRHTCPKNCVRPDHLRPATNKQQHENLVGAQSNSRSGVRGVYWDESRGRWVARVGHHGKMVYAGTFRALDQAEAAVVAKRLELYTHNDADRG